MAGAPSRGALAGVPVSDKSDRSDESDKSDAGLDRRHRTPLRTRQGATQIAPGRRGQTPPNDQRETRNSKLIDPCGRTSRCRCDHKGRGIWGNRNPPVIGTSCLDRGLAEWHPSGAPALSPIYWAVRPVRSVRLVRLVRLGTPPCPIRYRPPIRGAPKAKKL